GRCERDEHERRTRQVCRAGSAVLQGAARTRRADGGAPGRREVSVAAADADSRRRGRRGQRLRERGRHQVRAAAHRRLPARRRQRDRRPVAAVLHPLPGRTLLTRARARRSSPPVCRTPTVLSARRRIRWNLAPAGRVQALRRQRWLGGAMDTHGTDGRVISDTENPHSFSHAAIARAAGRMAPAEIATPVAAWIEIADIVSAAADRFEAAVARAADFGWQGAAAEAARPRIHGLRAGPAALAAAPAAQPVPFESAADAAARFRAAVPPPVEGATGSDAARARNAAEEQARDDMADLYLRPYVALAPTLPSFPAPASSGGAGAGTAADQARQLLSVLGI